MPDPGTTSSHALSAGTPEGARYRFFGGKGGVGKTTCAAASAVVAAEARRRVLVISTDPAHSLGDAFRTRLGPRPKPLATRQGHLEAAELDADRALERWLSKRRPMLRTIAERGTYLDEDDIEELLRLSFPGVDELVGLVEVRRLARAGRYDDVLVDTAPTGHTLRLLAMPETLTRIASVLDQMHAKHRFLADTLGRGHRADASDALIEEIAAEGRALHTLLRDPARCVFSWVLLPEALSVEETRDALRELDAAGISVRDLIVNRVTPPPPAPCPRCDAKRAAERAALRTIPRHFARCAVRTLPSVEREPRGGAALRALGRALCRRTSGAAIEDAAPRIVGRHRERPSRVDAIPAWLDIVAPADTRLLLFAGKGGVGKTTCAATVALLRAKALPSRKLLLLSADPAHSLGAVFGLPLGDEDHLVPGAPGALRARELDANRAFRERRERYRRAVDQLFERLRGGSRFDPAFDREVMRDLIDLAPPGLDELFAALTVIEALFPGGDAGAAYDTVILDTAPTGHALRLLGFPDVALGWIHALLAILLKYRQVVGLGGLAEDLVEVARDLRRLSALLRDPRQARVVAVTAPTELPRLETVRLLRRLEEMGIAVSAVVVNALTPRGCRRCDRAATVEARVVEAFARDCAAMRPGRRPMILAPSVAPPPRGVPALQRWGHTWTGART